MMDGGKPCCVIVRGTASKTMQAKMRLRQRKAVTNKSKKSDGDFQIMEDIHNHLCEGAASFIVGFENVSKGDTPATAADAEWFLDLTFPEMGLKEDADGLPVLDASGSPEFEMKNNPFAKQVGEYAGKQVNHMGNSASA
jgi:hypothetical protein